MRNTSDTVHDITHLISKPLKFKLGHRDSQSHPLQTKEQQEYTPGKYSTMAKSLRQR